MGVSYSLEEIRQSVFYKNSDQLAYVDPGSLKRNIRKAAARDTSDPDFRRIISECIKADSFPADVARQAVSMLPRQKRLKLIAKADPVVDGDLWNDGPAPTQAAPAAPTVPAVNPQYTQAVVTQFYQREREKVGGLSPFDGIRHEDANGEWWDARELQGMLGYGSKWQNFESAIARAMESAEANGLNSGHHFTDLSKMMPTGKGASREVVSYRLTRHACHLIAQNGDATKREIADAQAYFSIQTRRAELQDAGASPIERTEGVNELIAGQGQILTGIGGLGESIGSLEDVFRKLLEKAMQAIMEEFKDILPPEPKSDLRALHGSLYEQVLKQDYKSPRGYICPCCEDVYPSWESQYFHVDHWYNLSRADEGNGWLICKSCNLSKLGRPGSPTRERFLKLFDAFQHRVKIYQRHSLGRGQTKAKTGVNPVKPTAPGQRNIWES